MTKQLLGKRPPKHDPRTLKLSKYATAIPLPPDEVSWITHVPSWPMFLNDQLGDCVIAGIAHTIQQWSLYAAELSRTSGGNLRQVTLANGDVLSAYEAIGGYVPGDASTDNGVVLLDALKYWKAFGIGGHKIAAYMAVDITNMTEVFQAIQLFGNVLLGLNLPATAQGEDAWTVADGGPANNPDAEPGTWGGHMVPVMAASPLTLTSISWGDRLKMSHNFFKDYADEAWAVVSPDWIGKTGFSPSGFDLKQLVDDLIAIQKENKAA